MNITVIRPVEEGAFVYHDGLTIRGVSFIADSELAAKFDSFSIPIENGVDFVQGNFEVTQWFVWQDTNGFALHKASTDDDASIDLDTLIDDTFTLIPEIVSVSQPSLAIKVYRESQHIAINFHSLLPFKSTYDPEFVFTEKNDPSAVLFSLRVSAEELFNDREIDMALPIDLTKQFDVYTRRLFPGYGIEYLADSEAMFLTLPKGHFIDLMKFERKSIKRGLQALVSRPDRQMELSLVGGAIPTFKRSTPFLRLLFSMPNDPTLMLHTMTVSVADLRDGTITLDLPEILDQPFDVWAPLMYREISLLVF